MITFGDRKMSKSLGNIMTAREFLEKYDAEIMKYMLLSVHYRSLSDFSEQAIGFAVHGLARVYSALNLSVKWSAAWVASSAAAPVSAGNVRVPLAFQTALDQAERDLVEALNDDFNTPEMFAAIFSLVRAFNSINKTGLKVTAELAASAEKFREWVLNAGQLLSLFQEEPSAYLMKLDDRLLGEKGQSRESIEALVAERSAARAEKNFKRSDELRDQLVAMGIVIQDSPQGTTWEVAK
jgi:cysteinyl-tRNA synthetase